MAKITVVIPTFNCLRYLKLCISTMRDGARTNPDTLVVVDGSTDGTVEWLQEQRIPYLYRWEEKRPPSEKDGGTRPQLVGRCYQNLNIGGVLANSEVVFFANDDCVFAPGWDEGLLKHLTPQNMVVNQIVEPGVEVPPWLGILKENFGICIDDFRLPEWLHYAESQSPLMCTEKWGLNIGLMCYKDFFVRELLPRGGWHWMDNPPDNMWTFPFVRVCSVVLYHFSGAASRRGGYVDGYSYVHCCPNTQLHSLPEALSFQLL
jgi:glycosyltransferase involved in cell wall biosynthesis